LRLPSEGCPTKLLILSGKKIVAEQPAITTEEGASAFRVDCSKGQLAAGKLQPMEPQNFIHAS
jgi:hypothetical protein